MPRHEQSSIWEVPAKPLPKCKYGHHHLNRRACDDCEERTFKALCARAGVDYERLKGLPLYEGALPPDPEQLDLF